MKRASVVRAAYCSMVCLLLLSGICHAESSYFDVDRTMFPYYPSLLKWTKSSAPFTAPEVCAKCHPKQYEEWTGSSHAQAFQDPLYQGEMNKGFKALGHEVTRQCEGCHSPAGVVTEEIKGPGLAGLSRMALAGVSCDICHSVSAVTHFETPSNEPENGSLVLTPGEDTKDGMRLIKYGPSKPADGCGGGFHVCKESTLHVRAEMCGACHQLSHYKSFFPIESTYIEWRNSPYAQKNILCQDCHMVDIDTFIRTADTLLKPVPSKYHHYFGGANYLLSYFAEAAALKAGDTKLATMLRTRYDRAVAKLKAAADLEIVPVYRNKALFAVKVTVRNIRAGHFLPTSLTNMRQMWLEVVAKDASGQMVMQSGGIDKSGSLSPGTTVFNSEGMGTNFHFALDPWAVTSFGRNDAIPPKGYKQVEFSLSPLKRKGMVRVEARLRYRQADQSQAKKILEDLPADMKLEKLYGLSEIPSLPVVEMVQKKASFTSNQ